MSARPGPRARMQELEQDGVRLRILAGQLANQREELIARGPTERGTDAWMDERQALLVRRREVHQQLVAVRDERGDLFHKVARRPERGWLGLMCRGLGPLPDLALPDPGEFADVPRRRLLAYLTVLIPLALFRVVTWLLPVSGVTVITGTAAILGIDETIALTVQFIGLVVFLGLLVWVARVLGKNALYRMAVDEEAMFRLGCEGWTPWQRLRSCIQFGFAHLINVVVAAVTPGGVGRCRSDLYGRLSG